MKEKMVQRENDEIKSLLKQQGLQLARMCNMLQDIQQKQQEHEKKIQTLVNLQQGQLLKPIRLNKTNNELENLNQNFRNVVSNHYSIVHKTNEKLDLKEKSNEDHAITTIVSSNRKRKRREDSKVSYPSHQRKEMSFVASNETLEQYLVRFYQKELTHIANTLRPVGSSASTKYIDGYIDTLIQSNMKKYTTKEIAKAMTILYANGYHKQQGGNVVHQFIHQFYLKIGNIKLIEHMFIFTILELEKHPRSLHAHRRLEGIASLSNYLPTFSTKNSFCMRSAIIYWLLDEVIQDKPFAFEKMLRVLSSNRLLVNMIPLFQRDFSYLFYQYSLKALKNRKHTYKTYVTSTIQYLLNIKDDEPFTLANDIRSFCDRVLISIPGEDQLHYVDPSHEIGIKLILVYIRTLPDISWPVIYEEVIIKILFGQIGNTSLAIQFICHVLGHLINTYYDGSSSLSPLIKRLKQIIEAGDLFHFKTRCISLSTLIEIGMPPAPYAKEWIQSSTFMDRFHHEPRVLQWIHPSLHAFVQKSSVS